MALTAQELITLSEITGESRESAAAVSVDSDLETALRAEIAVWNANRDKVNLEVRGEVDLRAKRLLDAIRKRVRVWMGFPALTDDERVSLPPTLSAESCVRW